MRRAESSAVSECSPQVDLFALRPRRVSRDEATFSIELDAREPYLDDHRPGGHPLFSTVMAIEAAVTGARHFAPDAEASVTDVHVYKPYILGPIESQAIDLSVSRHTNDVTTFSCTLSSGREGCKVTHLQAVVRMSPTADVTIRVPSIPTHRPPHFTSTTAVVNAARIYDVFFHGPSFQVIAEAQYQSGKMRCRLRQGLPDSHRVPGAVSRTAPRLVEFALQSAGLLEIARNGRMKIPDFVGSIERFVPIDVDFPRELFAMASYGSVDEAFIDIDIIDASNRLLLRVNEYRTVVLPFSVSAAAITALRAEFRG